MGKSTISMAIFNSSWSLPEGKPPFSIFSYGFPMKNTSIFNGFQISSKPPAPCHGPGGSTCQRLKNRATRSLVWKTTCHWKRLQMWSFPQGNNLRWTTKYQLYPYPNSQCYPNSKVQNLNLAFLGVIHHFWWGTTIGDVGNMVMHSDFAIFHSDTIELIFYLWWGHDNV